MIVKSIIRYFLLLLLIATFRITYAQQLNDSIPLPTHVVSGKLPTGLKYIIHPNKNSSQKVELRMVVGIGSIVENADERGMAHLLEHMAFKGSKNFPGDSIVESLRSLGIKYGFDLNAYTGYDKTVFILPIPTDQPDNVDLGLKIIYDWANNLSLLPAAIRDEKKVVYQEIKDHVPIDDFAEFKLEDSRYANMIAIGNGEQVKRITPDKLKEFYNCWYRPDLITLIAVGDLNPIELEKKIIEQFADFKSRGKAHKRVNYELPTKGKTLLKTVEDTTIYNDKIELIFPVKDQAIETFSNLKNKLVTKVFTHLVNERLKADSCIDCSFTNSWYLSNNAHAVFSLDGDNGAELLRGIYKIGEHLARIREYGFGEKELDAAYQNYRGRLSDDNLQFSSGYWCDNYIDMAITGDRYVSNQVKKTFFEKHLPSIGNDELSKEITHFINKTSKLFVCARFNPNKTEGYTLEEIIQAWKKGLKSRTSPYIFKEKDTGTNEVKKISDFVVVPSQEGKIAQEKFLSNLGVKELILDNGIKVAFKVTNSQDKNIEMSMFSRGGLSTLPDSLYHYYEGTAAYVDMGGAGEYTASQLSDIMYDLDISISTLIADYYHMLYGSSSSGNLEDLLKLFYLKITAPGKDYEDFEEVITSEAEDYGSPNPLLAALNRSPGRILQKKISTYSGAIPVNTRQFKSGSDIKQMNLDSITSFYSSLFTKTKGTTLLICGNLDEANAIKLVKKYIGTLPKTDIKNRCRFMGGCFPSGIHRDTIIDPDNTRPQMTYLIHGDYTHSLKETLIFKIMRDIIQNRLVKRLREENGLVYSPYVTVNYTSYPREYYCFQIDYSCDKSNITHLEDLLFSELTDLAEHAVSATELAKITQSFLVTKRDVLTLDNYSAWRKKLQEIYLEENSINSFDKYDQIIRSITPLDLKEAFNRYTNNKRYTVLGISN
ncbi:insulinase family protein [Puteibacter caeruleilacunae]|nr:insulinase family protein [Puteibacter caeruleilacunae]